MRRRGIEASFAALFGLTLLACTAPPEAPAGPDAGEAAPTGAAAREVEPTLSFTEIASESGLVFRHDIGATGHLYFPEIMGSGCALLDYDGDGDLDVYLVQGGPLGPESRDRHSPESANRLFRNDLRQGAAGPEPRFVDVTETSGAGDTGYGMGVAVGDYDNDGDPDIYVTNFGPDALLRNDGDGTFTDVTRHAGLGDPRWTASASFLDADGDGDLDLFVTAYADYTLASDVACYTPAGQRDYCGPTAYLSVPGRFYRNKADGTFEDATADAGLDLAYGHGLGVVAADFDGDGRQDLYVANDSDQNQLWMNHGGSFQDVALIHGVAYNEMGIPEAGMGIAVADHDSDGDQDLLVTHLIGESNRLYENQGGAFFEDATSRKGLSWPSLPFTGFGVGWFDADNDSDLDLYVVNGNVRTEEVHRQQDHPFDQPNLLMLNMGGGRYTDVSAGAGEITSLSEVGRGAAFGDVDNDGDVDVLVSNNNGPVRLFRNDLKSKGSWLVLRVVDAGLKRDAIGAEVSLRLDDGRVFRRTVRTDGSYLSASDPRVQLAWPAGVQATRLEVMLPGSAPVEVPLPEPGRTHTIIAGGPGPAGARR